VTGPSSQAPVTSPLKTNKKSWANAELTALAQPFTEWLLEIAHRQKPFSGQQGMIKLLEPRISHWPPWPRSWGKWLRHWHTSSRDSFPSPV
jgi:hypothetical protein